MKKIIYLIITTLLLLTFTACSNTSKSEVSDKYKIVCTTYPQYDWVKEIIKGKEDLFDLTLLMNSSIDLHNYEPSAKDIITINESDLFIYIGGESDDWAEEVIKKEINTLKLIELIENPLEVHHDHEEEHEEEHDHTLYDEHIWLSLNNAKTLVNKISDEITQLNNDKIYKTNANEYTKKLEALDNDFKEFTKTATYNTIIVADRFPFRYLFKDYNLTYHSAFEGCSAETEVSFDVITNLAKEIDELNIKYVVVLENSSNDIAKTVIENTNNKNQTIVKLNSIQSYDPNKTYLEIMTENIEQLKTILK